MFMTGASYRISVPSFVRRYEVGPAGTYHTVRVRVLCITHYLWLSVIWSSFTSSDRTWPTMPHSTHFTHYMRHSWQVCNAESPAGPAGAGQIDPPRRTIFFYYRKNDRNFLERSRRGRIVPPGSSSNILLDRIRVAGNRSVHKENIQQTQHTLTHWVTGRGRC